jgi:hypothetical protein
LTSKDERLKEIKRELARLAIEIKNARDENQRNMRLEQRKNLLIQQANLVKRTQ